jgi:hypothetical protein
MTGRIMLLHLTGVVTSLGVCLAGAVWLSSSEPTHVALGALLFTLGLRAWGCGASPGSSNCGTDKGSKPLGRDLELSTSC